MSQPATSQDPTGRSVPPADWIAVDWIAVDWGTSRLRAWAMDGSGAVIAAAESEMGMGRLTAEGYEPALLDLAGGWLAPDRETPALICGMAGARQGWAEAPYAPAGRPLAEIARAAIRPPVADRHLSPRILPGVMQPDPPDVMRGEETQLLGLLHRAPEFDGLVCLPGTHSKWARVAGGAVRRFDTYMTGELFAALGAHTVLSHSLAAEGWDAAAFRAQLAIEASSPTPLARGLFGLRARHLLEGAGPAEIRARLSALLIGAELSAALAAAGGLPVRLLAGGALADRYATALAAFGAEYETADAGEAVLDGLRAARELMREDA